MGNRAQAQSRTDRAGPQGAGWNRCGERPAVRHRRAEHRLRPRRRPERGTQGRWPGNVLLDQSQAAELDRQAGEPASRFFWVAKPAQSERVRVGGVAHPTVKPLALMRHLVRLVTPSGGTVLEPFAGSGTTVEACLLEGFRVIAIERDAGYLPLILQRIDRRLNPVAAVTRGCDDPGLFDLLDPDVA